MKRRVFLVTFTGVLGCLLVGLFLATASPAAVQAADPMAPEQLPFWKEDFSAALPPGTYYVAATGGSGLVDSGSFLLTQSATGQHGRIFFLDNTLMADFVATFRLYLGNYNGGADGAAFHFCPDYGYAPDAGGTLDASCPGGYFVAFDTIEDSYDDLVYVGHESYATRLKLAAVPNLEDGAWHDVAVLFDQGTISVYLDGDAVISRFAIPDYEPFLGYFGFSAATGALANVQRVDDIRVFTDLGYVEGNVYNAERMVPIGGATIQAVREDGSLLNAMTDPTGYYSMTVPTGIYTVTAGHPTYLTGLASGVEVGDGEATTVDFDLTPKMAVEPHRLEAWLLQNTNAFAHPTGLEISNNTDESLEFRVFDFPRTLASVAQGNLELRHLATRTLEMSVRSERPSSLQQTTQVVVPTAPSSMAGTGVLLIQDTLPWGSAAMETILADNLIPYDQINSSQIPTVDFWPYKMIIIPSVQGSAYNTNFNDNLSKFESYIDAGGLVLMSFCDWTIFFPFRTLPFGGTNNYEVQSTNYIVDPAHPIFAGVANPFSGNWASHNTLSGLLLGDRVLVTAGAVSGGNPVMIERGHGAGMLVAGGQTFEYGGAPGLILENMIPYYYFSWVPNDVPWLWEAPITGTIPPISTASVDVLFTSVVTGPMPLGTYTATLRVVGPGYGAAIPDVDVTMHVVEAFEDPVASFTSNAPVRYGEAVDFTNTSADGLPPTDYYEWDFGDGSTATMLTADPVHHVYGKPGVYTVELTAHQAQTGVEVAYTRTIVVTAQLFVPLLRH